MLELKGTAVEPMTEANGVGLGPATVRPPTLIDLLAQDFGIVIDEHEPEAFQRSAVRNVVQWLDLKGTQKSYDILGKISGYRVEAFGLWRVDPVPDALPSDSVFESPFGSGKFYTNLDPTRGFFDEITADTVPLDLFCFEELDWTTDAITPPGPPGSPAIPDGTSVEDAIAFALVDRPITTTVDLGGGLWRVTIGPDTGTGDSFTGPSGSGVMTFEDLSGPFVPNMVGGRILIAGATSPANNGTFLVTEVPTPNTIRYVNAAGVAEAFGGTWTAAPHNPMALVGYWFGDFAGTPGTNLFLETFSEPSFGLIEFEVLAGTAPVFGATVSIKYLCRPSPDCGYCRASVLRVEIVPAEVLSEPDALLDGVLPRLANKILQVVPAHVRITDLVHILGPVEAALTITVTATASSAIFAFASVGYYYDIVPADEIETDPDHIAVSATVFTVP